MVDTPKPPENYVPEFCAAVIIQSKDEIKKISQKASDLLYEFNFKFKEIVELISENDKKNDKQTDKFYFEFSENDKKQNDRTDKFYLKFSELEILYHNMDKELYKAKEIYNVVLGQSKINVDFNGQFTSLEKRIKILFGIIFLILSGNLTLFYFIIKSWFGG